MLLGHMGVLVHVRGRGFKSHSRQRCFLLSLETCRCFISQTTFPLRTNKNMLFPPRIELGTLRVLGARDDHYTTETGLESCDKNHI